MLTLITDRTQENVDRLKELSAKGWNNMTKAEQLEWSGDPLQTEGANLITQTVLYTAGVDLQFRGASTIVRSLWDGVYIYAILLIGPAADYAGKTMTFSLDSLYSSGGGTPNAALFWHDDSGAEFAGAALSEAGSITFAAYENTGGRQYLALYLYATTDASILAGAYIRYEGLMLEMGSTRHPYAPYYQVLPTPATKGAYNFSDFNRVEAAVAELATSAGITLETKTYWTRWDLPKEADIARYLGNIATLREALPLPSSVPATPTSLDKMTFETANNIEIIIEALAEAAESLFRSGDLYSGEV